MSNEPESNLLINRTNHYLLKHLATIFIRLELNFNSDLKNVTKLALPTDCLTSYSQRFLFKTVASHLEFEILNLFESSIISFVSAKSAFYHLENILSDSLCNFVQFYLPNKSLSFSKPDFSADFSICDLTIWTHILNYFIKGDSQYFYCQKSVKLSCDLLEDQILAILNHFVIQISNIIIKFLLYHDERLFIRNLFYIVCDVSFLSSRYLMNLKNNLLLFRAVNFYIYDPKLIYENKYSLLYINSNTICSKKIYSDRHRELTILSKPQLLVVILLELQDLFFPKIKNLVYLLGKSIIYIFSYFVGTALKILLNKFPI
uniref:hypothetical protein n=1 Tax=Pseudoerythrocladia kornmannii TaxID=753682 RepID=UPI001BEE5AB5|nr:hypothetical protein MW575_pgp050 [Pseudoerythrocladia kornmannii]QUE28306.1 Ycf55 [Pseudoerythrocladia kornmannii]UNJ16810.1 hypothetical protein [Pseudoerythrocladia kornmannii]